MVKPSGLVTIIVLLDDDCNMSCKYCYFDCGNSTAAGKTKRNNYLDVIREYVEVKEIINIEFSGYIPKHIEDIRGLLSGINDRKKSKTKINLYIQLNGLDVNYEVVRLIHDFNITAGISLDGPEYINDRARIGKNGEGTGKQVEKSVHLLNDNAVKFYLRCTIGKHNYAHPKILFDYFKSLAPAGVFINKLITNRNTLNGNDLSISYDEFIGFYHEYHSLVVNSGAANLLDSYLKKWFYRFANKANGWSHFCSTGLCNVNGNEFLVLSPTRTAKCPKY